MHSRRWDAGCSDGTVAVDAVPARRIEAWLATSGSRVINDGRNTRESMMKVGQSGSETKLFATAPDLTIIGPGVKEARWGDLEYWGSDHMAISTHMSGD